MAQRYEAVGPDDICLFIYTSGTTGPPKGCLLSHGNYRSITDAAVKNSVLDDGDSAYLFLPLAHAFAILIEFVVFDLGTTLAYWSRDPKQIIPDLAQVQPTSSRRSPGSSRRSTRWPRTRPRTGRSSTRRWSWA